MGETESSTGWFYGQRRAAGRCALGSAYSSPKPQSQVPISNFQTIDANRGLITHPRRLGWPPMDEFKCLISLSQELEAQGCYLQAAKCLQAAVASHQALPASRAAACLDYAQLLTDHFDNLDLAKELLFQAERELRAVRGHQGLKCEVFDRLAACHRMRNNLEQASQAVASGLAAAADSPRWRAYFIARTAELRMERDGDADAALEALQDARAVPGLSVGDASLLSLAAAAVNLRAGRMDAADAALTAAATSLEEGAETLPEAVAARLRAHYFLLYAFTALAVGRASQMASGSDYPVFVQLQEQLSGAGVDGGDGSRAPLRRRWVMLPMARCYGPLARAAPRPCSWDKPRSSSKRRWRIWG